MDNAKIRTYALVGLCVVMGIVLAIVGSASLKHRKVAKDLERMIADGYRFEKSEGAGGQ